MEKKGKAIIVLKRKFDLYHIIQLIDNDLVALHFENYLIIVGGLLYKDWIHIEILAILLKSSIYFRKYCSRGEVKISRKKLRYITNAKQPLYICKKENKAGFRFFINYNA